MGLRPQSAEDRNGREQPPTAYRGLVADTQSTHLDMAQIFKLIELGK